MNAYEEEGVENQRNEWLELHVRAKVRFCVYCYQCGAPIFVPQWCAEHGQGQCPDTRWELTETAASFALEYQRLLEVRRVPPELWAYAEDAAQRYPGLTGLELAALFEVPPAEYPDDGDWP